MAKFKIEFTRELWCQAVVEAPDEETARQMFWDGNYEGESVRDEYIQEDVDVTEVDD